MYLSDLCGEVLSSVATAREEAALHHRFNARAVSLAALADFLNGRSNNRRAVFGMMKFQVHAPADKMQLQHRPAPSGARDHHQNRFRAILGMTGKQHIAASQQDRGVAMILRADLKHRRGRKLFQVDATLNF